MTVLAGASAGIRDMADGSLRITIEFEPKDAKNAFELFGTRGTPIAVAALKVGFAAVSEPVEPPAEKVKVGPLCREAVGYCEMPAFWDWLTAERFTEGDEQSAKSWMLHLCDISSRKELDTDRQAGQDFVNLVRVPFMRWMKQRQPARKPIDLHAAAQGNAGY